ncbi:hypothetical protein [Bradyrhizobium sp. SBR1B]|uniref:hypothetical protein n=1 Tax=Bradyrhizobium sp. SBR1B TaxID=2663836 RepID=UPI0017E98FD9|nr:hypothetical protein [Bradyrhizobium sp. SBR1B]MBB4379987.1 hypothetical protein [Bradyrhizobium sp. SBR1B]
MALHLAESRLSRRFGASGKYHVLSIGVRGFSVKVMLEDGAIYECEEHDWAEDRANPHVRERAFR